MARYRYKEDNFYKRLSWAIASLLFALLAYGIYYQYVMNTVQKMGNDIIDNSNKAAQRAIERSQQLQQEQLRQRQEKEQQKEKQEAEIAAAQRRAQALVQEKLIRKEEAWKAFYKPTQKCIDDPVTTECANAHIRAKNQFAATYKDD